ncbi:MAG: hypothetical protein ACOCX3_01690 [Chloroflexota bacterium]
MQRSGRLFLLVTIGWTALMIAFSLGLLVLLTAPQRLGLIRVGDQQQTAQAITETLIVLQGTGQAYEGLATRSFELAQTLATQEAALAATATENVARAARTFDAAAVGLTATAQGAQLMLQEVATGTATALAATERANVLSAYDNIVARATLEYENAVLAGTATSAAIQATDAAIQAVQTRVALESTAIVLAEQVSAFTRMETQVALDNAATATAAAARNAAQATQAALDFGATQQAYDVQATALERDLRGTQAALSAQATDAAQAFAVGPGASGQSTATMTPGAAGSSGDGGALAFPTGNWQVINAANWQINPSGALVVRAPVAVILSEGRSLEDYELQAVIEAPLGEAADYYVLLNLPEDETTGTGYALRLIYDGDTVTGAAVIQFSANDFRAGVPLAGSGSGIIETTALNSNGPGLSFAVSRQNQRIILSTATASFEFTLPDALDPGAVGLQLPAGAAISDLTLATSAP